MICVFLSFVSFSRLRRQSMHGFNVLSETLQELVDHFARLLRTRLGNGVSVNDAKTRNFGTNGFRSPLDCEERFVAESLASRFKEVFGASRHGTSSDM